MDMVVVDEETGCWVWQGTRTRLGQGYGTIRVGDGKQLAHRVSYELFVGPIPEGLVMDHFHCERVDCVNPNHVRPVTQRENVLRSETVTALHLAKTHCPRGHEYSGSNLIVDRRGQRDCRECRNHCRPAARRAS